jgi:hypothetical protein
MKTDKVVEIQGTCDVLDFLEQCEAAERDYEEAVG